MIPSDNIRKLEAERAISLQRAEAVKDVADQHEGDMTTDEESAFNGHLDDVEQIQGRIDREGRLERLALERAVTLTPEVTPSNLPTVTVTPVPTPPGLLFAKMACARALHKGDSAGALSWAKGKGDPLLAFALAAGDDVLRADPGAGDTTTDGWAEQIAGFRREASEFVDLLRAESILMRMPTREVTFGSVRTYNFPRQSGGIGGLWVGEDLAIQVEALAFDSISLSPLKAASIVVITRELAQYSEPAAMTLVRDDMIQGLATFIDLRFASATAAVAGVSPPGIFVGGGTSAGATLGTVVENITGDLTTAVNSLDAANIPSGNRVWIMHTTQRNELWGALDSLGNAPFRNEVSGGQIFGYPIIASNTMAAGTVGLVAASEVIKGVAPSPLVDISGDATIHMEDTAPEEDLSQVGAVPIVSLWQRDLLGTRTIFEVDWVKRHDAAAYLLTAVTGWS